jgi:N utilization substance protein B
MSRRVAREIAFKTLFQYDIGKNESEPALTELLDENGLSPESGAFARQLVEGVLTNVAVIDETLAKYLQKWELGRLAAVDRSVLRLAAFELLFRDDIPAAVTINEALELTKAFNSEESAKFLNGVLDRLAREKEDSEVQ